MSHEEITARAKELAPDFIKVLEIMSVNHKPHPYTLGPLHIGYANDHHSIYLTDEVIRAAEKAGKASCVHPDCTRSYNGALPYDDHTSETGLFISLTRNVTEEEAAALKPMMLFVESQNLRGVCFVDTSEKFRIG